MSLIKKILIGLGVLAVLGAAFAGWLYYAMTQPEIWVEDVGGGWKLAQRRYAMSHGTNFGVLYREIDGHRDTVDQFVYQAHFYPQVRCVAYGTTKEGVQIFGVCSGRRVRIVDDASEWHIRKDGVFKQGETLITPAQILHLAQRSSSSAP